jgi:mannobiose 2-epimerase
MLKRLRSLMLLACLCITWNSANVRALSKAAMDSLATDVDTMMINHYLKKYYPKVIDPTGGIHIFYDRQFNQVAGDNFNLDMQARHLWSASFGMMMHPEYAGFKQAADAAYAYIRDKMWDKANGGSGIATGNAGAFEAGPKAIYSNGFALMGLSAYYMATKDTMPLYIAKTTFKFIDNRNYDSQYGWYFGSGQGDKNQDIGHHWLEGMAWLYLAWPNSPADSAQKSLLKKRVKDMSDLFVSSKWVRSDGSICLSNNREMTSGSGTTSGLCAEDVYLIYFYYQAIGVKPSQSTIDVLKKVHAYARTQSTPGQHFGIQWWWDAELLASYCSMGTILNAGDSYLNDFRKHWNFIKAHYFDPVYGGWYDNPDATGDRKGFEWCATYHGMKCMLFCRNWLFGGDSGWVDAKRTVNVKNSGNFNALKNATQGKKEHYIVVMGNGARLEQSAVLYDLTGRNASVRNAQSGAGALRKAGVYILKP